MKSKNILITGGSGYIGYQLGKKLQENPQYNVIGMDIRNDLHDPSFKIVKMDIRDSGLTEFLAQNHITHVIHLASIVSPGIDEQLEYDIDVNGTANVIQACRDNQVQQLTVTSSGAAYGYYADNPDWLSESDPIRGNDSFSYSKHKRLVEELLAQFSAEQSKTKVLIMRPCTVLGNTTNNKITSLFERKRLLAVGGSDSPFVFIWDQDVVNALEYGVVNDKKGTFNLAGDGQLTVVDLAKITHKSILRIPAAVIRCILWCGKTLGLSQTGPEQVKFLQYRPVLSNEKLKKEFGYIPEKSSEQAFLVYWNAYLERSAQ